MWIFQGKGGWLNFGELLRCVKPDQLSLHRFSRRRFDDIQGCRVSMAWLIDPAVALAWTAMQVDIGLQVIGIGLTQDVSSCEKGPKISSVNHVKDGAKNRVLGQSNWSRDPQGSTMSEWSCKEEVSHSRALPETPKEIHKGCKRMF